MDTHTHTHFREFFVTLLPCVTYSYTSLPLYTTKLFDVLSPSFLQFLAIRVFRPEKGTGVSRSCRRVGVGCHKGGTFRNLCTKTSSMQPLCTQHTSGTGRSITNRLNVKDEREMVCCLLVKIGRVTESFKLYHRPCIFLR